MNIQQIDCFALDMDGTIYLGEKLIDGAKEFLNYLKENGKKYIFLTNNSSKNKHNYVEKLQMMGISVCADDILTSGEATALYLKEIKSKARIFLLGTQNLTEEFLEQGFLLTKKEPDFVVLGFDQTLNYEKLVEACHLIREGVPFVATHPDINCPTNERSGYLPDVGAILELIFASTGKKAKIIGKPNREIIEILMKKVACAKNKIAMVGDRLYTDVQMAINADIKSILVLSGETTADDLKNSKVQPDFVFKSVKELKMKLAGEMS